MKSLYLLLKMPGNLETIFLSKKCLWIYICNCNIVNFKSPESILIFLLRPDWLFLLSHPYFSATRSVFCWHLFNLVCYEVHSRSRSINNLGQFFNVQSAVCSIFLCVCCFVIFCVCSHMPGPTRPPISKALFFLSQII